MPPTPRARGTPPRCEYQALTDERRALVHRDPELVTHTGEAADPSNAIADLDKRIADLGDLADSAARVEHAKGIEQSKRQAFEDQARNHGPALDEARRPEGESLLSAFTEAAATLGAVADQLVAFGHRSMEFAHIQKQDTQRIPIDGVADAQRTARGLADSPPALPIQPREGQ
jgi:hypothetical protein